MKSERTMLQTDRQAEVIARIALELTDQMTNRDVLAALLKAYVAGRNSVLDDLAARGSDGPGPARPG